MNTVSPPNYYSERGRDRYREVVIDTDRTSVVHSSQSLDPHSY
jgi:hypothetical protein